jgi:hypothetical protein
MYPTDQPGSKRRSGVAPQKKTKRQRANVKSRTFTHLGAKNKKIRYRLTALDPSQGWTKYSSSAVHFVV